MIISLYIVFNPDGFVKITKSYPSLAVNEIVILQHFNLDKAIFEKPQFEANLSIEEVGSAFELTISQIEQEIEKLKKGKTND